MAQAEFRFYATLNDFLPPARRGRTLLHQAAENASVKQAIEALGVPHPEVALLLADGAPVDFNHRVRDGMRISAYPKLQHWGLDWLRLPPAPRLLTDAHLGHLAAYLRLLGLDTRHCKCQTDAQIAALAQAEERIVLTRDRALLMHRNIVHGHYLRRLVPLQQAREVLDRFDLQEHLAPMSRCLRCNGALIKVAKADVAADIPADTRMAYEDYRRCPGCQQIYWQGGHHAGLQWLITQMTTP